MKSHFAMMADYNAWANGRLYMARSITSCAPTSFGCVG
jgi:uncharacterized damage-inducible protein DinB